MSLMPGKLVTMNDGVGMGSECLGGCFAEIVLACRAELPEEGQSLPAHRLFYQRQLPHLLLAKDQQEAGRFGLDATLAPGLA
jgi:hypothetical protein